MIGDGLVERIAELEAEVELLRAQLERERATSDACFCKTTGTTPAFPKATAWVDLAKNHRNT